jgi:uncharacterized protein YqgV (UPF0045/DUF77 family)
MKSSVEISYYPLNEEYIPPIRAFIDRMNTYEGLIVRTNGMSTQIFGEYDTVMEALTREIRHSFDHPHSVFVMKIINADLDTKETR